MVSGQWLVNQKSEIRSRTISNPQSLIPNPFCIRTPTATVTDLGTEFGVEVTKDQRAHVNVFQGKVVLERGAKSYGTAQDRTNGGRIGKC